MCSMTKRIYLEARKCLRRGWYARNLPDTGEHDEVAQFYSDQGNEVGEWLRGATPMAFSWSGPGCTIRSARRSG